MQKLDINVSNGPALTDIVLAQRERAKTLEMAEKSRYFFQEEIEPVSIDGKLFDF